MTTINLTLELVFNNRTIAGVEALTHDYTIESWYGYRQKLVVTLRGLDLGRWDAEGDAYLVDLLNIVPGDIIYWEEEEA
jgi:hypothetical protein